MGASLAASASHLDLVRLLQAGERNIDELCELTGYNAPEINLALTDMELSGIIKQSPGRLFSLE